MYRKKGSKTKYCTLKYFSVNQEEASLKMYRSPMIIEVQAYLIDDEISSTLARNIQHAVNAFSQFWHHGFPLVRHQLPF